MAQSHATNPQRGPNAPIGRDGGSVAPPMVEPLEQIKEAVADTDNARNGDEMERQRRQDRKNDGGAQAHVEPVGRRGSDCPAPVGQGAGAPRLRERVALPIR